MYTPFSDTPICSILQQSSIFSHQKSPLAAGGAAAAGPNVGLPAQIGDADRGPPWWCSWGPTRGNKNGAPLSALS